MNPSKYLSALSYMHKQMFADIRRCLKSHIAGLDMR